MPRGETPHNVRIGGQNLPLRVRWNARARRLTMTIDHTQRCLRLVLPQGVKAETALSFCQRNEAWILERWAALPALVPFEPGRLVPLYGLEHEIRHCPEARRGVWQDEDLLCVSGTLEHLPRRVESYCRAEAGRRFRAAVKQKTAAAGLSAGRITLRESRSRWGSCSPKGDLSFCWRLIFAPPEVLDYVAAHEVAHLRHMDHSPAFWALCASLVPDIKAPKRWLARNGAGLWRYGSGGYGSGRYGSEMATPGTQM